MLTLEIGFTSLLSRDDQSLNDFEWFDVFSRFRINFETFLPSSYQLHLLIFIPAIFEHNYDFKNVYIYGILYYFRS